MREGGGGRRRAKGGEPRRDLGRFPFPPVVCETAEPTSSARSAENLEAAYSADDKCLKY